MYDDCTIARNELNRLAHEAHLHLDARQRRIDLLLRNHERASLNGTTGVLVGTYDRTRRSFRWGWADPDVPEALVSPLEDLRAVGETRGFPELTEGEWQGSEADASSMAMITALVLDGRGTHRVDIDNRVTYYVLLDPIAFESLPPAASGEW